MNIENTSVKVKLYVWIREIVYMAVSLKAAYEFKEENGNE